MHDMDKKFSRGRDIEKEQNRNSINAVLNNPMESLNSRLKGAEGIISDLNNTSF